MNNRTRRSFIGDLATASALPLLPLARQEQIKETENDRDAIIDQVELVKVTGPSQFSNTNRQYQTQPVHIYPDHRPEPYSEPESSTTSSGTTSHHYLRIGTRGGIEGIYGYLDPETVSPIVGQLQSFLLGKNALQIEKLWDLMYRRNRHSRAGHYMMGLSAVDNTLWDIRGKYFGVPVYQLLGGATREEIRVYGSCLGYSVEPGKAGPQAKQFYDQGFKHQKWFLAYGPGSGTKGLKLSVDLVREIREAVGYDLQLMFDAFMGWDLPFATAWASAVEQYNPYWIEEAFPTNRPDSFRQLSESTRIAVATGEHFYNRWEVLNFLRSDAIQIVQADPEWCGGVSELVKICHLASAFGAKVFPHGHNLHAAMHVVASQSPEVCPLVEYLINYVPGKMHFQKDPPLTDNGVLPFPEKPGFGIELDREKIEREEVLS